MRLRRLVIVVVSVVLLASTAAAQFQRGRRGGFNRAARFATLEDFDGGFQFCRLVFRQSPNGDGAGWSVDCPRADINLSIRLSELTRTPVSMDEQNDPKPLLVNLADPEALSHCPFIMMTEPGARLLRRRRRPNRCATICCAAGSSGPMISGASTPGTSWRTSCARRCLRPPIRSSICRATIRCSTRCSIASSVPQIPGIGYWDGGNRTWERAPSEAVAHIRAINDDRGRVMVLMTHDTDFGDSYEREAENPEYFMNFSVPGYAFGINVLVYAMTH